MKRRAGNGCRRGSPAVAGRSGCRDGWPVRLPRRLASQVAATAGRSEVATAFLLPLDRLEQGLEVALAEALGAVPLDQLEEDRGPVLDRLGEDLQQVAILVPVRQDVEFPQFIERYPGVAHPLTQGVVVAVRGLEEVAARGSHAP